MVFFCPNCNRSYQRQGKWYRQHIDMCDTTNNNNDIIEHHHRPLSPPPARPRATAIHDVINIITTLEDYRRRDMIEMEERRRQEEERREQRRLEEEERRRQDEERREQRRLEEEERRRQDEERREQRRLEEEERRELRRQQQEERRDNCFMQMFLKMEEFRREDHRAMLERKDEKLRIMRESLQIQRDTLDFQKAVYLECKTERASYIQEKHRIQSNVNNQPRIMSSTDICQKGELVVYGTRAEQWFKTDDLKHYVHDLTNGSDPQFREQVVEAIHEFVDAASFQSSDIEEHVSDRFVPISQWEECSIVMEQESECPPQLVARHLRNIECHLPYSPFVDIDSYEYPKEPLFQTTSLPDSKRFQEDVGDIVKPNKYSTDEHRNMIEKIRKKQGGYDDSVFSIHTVHSRRKTMQKRWRIYMENHKKNMFVWNFVAYNRARLEIIRHRLKKYAVYHPDFMERYLQDQMYKKRNDDTCTNIKRCFFSKRFADKLIGVCDLCGSQRSKQEMEAGHVVPAMRDYRGYNTIGTNGLHNLVVTCVRCNRDAGSMDPYLSKTFRVNHMIQQRRMKNSYASIVKSSIHT